MRYLIRLFIAAMIAGATTGAAVAEDFLSRDDRRIVQRSLTVAGYDTRGVDGVFGKGTRRAIRDWQTDRGFRSTGRLTERQFSLIVGDGVRTERRNRAGDDEAWNEARALNDEAAYRAYLRRYPKGRYADRARDILDRRDLAGVYRDREEALGLSRNQRREVEDLLARAGYFPGSVNGKFGPTARQAIRDYRRDRGLPVHAYLDREMLRLLVRDTNRTYGRRHNGEDNTDLAVGVAAGALLLGGIILLSD